MNHYSNFNNKISTRQIKQNYTMIYFYCELKNYLQEWYGFWSSRKTSRNDIHPVSSVLVFWEFVFHHFIYLKYFCCLWMVELNWKFYVWISRNIITNISFYPKPLLKKNSDEIKENSEILVASTSIIDKCTYEKCK